MPRKALRCGVELDIHTVSCPGVYLPYRNDVYLSVTLFRGQYRRTQLSSPTFPLMFHEKFRFDKVFYTAYQPQQVADALESDHIRIELVQLSDIRECGRLLAYYESNARDFLYPYPQYSISYGCADRQILMERTLEFPGIAPKLDFSTKTTLTEVDRPIGDASFDVGLLSDSYLSAGPRSSRSPVRRKSLSRRRSASPGLSRSLRDMCLYDSRDDDEKPPFVVRKVDSGLIGRKPGTKHPRQHKLRCSKSRSPPRYKIGGGYLGDDYRAVTRRYSPRRKVVREPATDFSSDDDHSDVLSEASDPGLYLSTRPSSASYRRRRSPSPIRSRQSLRERFDDDVLTTMIERKVDDAIRRNRSRERPTSRGSYQDEDFKRIRDLERDLEISRNRSFVHMNDGEYWTQKAADYKGKSHRALFNDNLEKVYSDMYTKAKKFDDRVY